MSVTDVLGDMDADAVVRTLEKKCGAALLRVDASSSSFTWISLSRGQRS